MQNNPTMLVTLTVDELNDLLRTTINECLEIKGEQDEFLDRAEMMQRLSCGSTFLNDLTKSIPHYKIGKKVLYNWREVKESLKVFRSE